MQKQSSVVKLKHNSVKNYDWGSHNPECYVCKLSKTKPNPTAAELWMGTHPKGESQLENQQGLSEYLKQKGLQPLEFLFKVLSIEKCLSIQIHPNKQQAIELNQKLPHIYVDANDKPEMFFTLSDFQCFLGFVSGEKFVQIMKVPPFDRWAGMEIVKVIGSILSVDHKQGQKLINEAIGNLHLIHKDREDLYKRLQVQFPGDIGLLISMLLQYWRIEKEKCFYIPAKIPHAYIHGQCLEIMKNSDNVIRMGLTPKLKDLETLQQILTQEEQKLSEVIAEKQHYDSHNLHFQVIKKNQTLQTNQHEIGIVIEGKFSINGEGMEEGSVVFMEKGTHEVIGEGLMCIGWSSF